MSMIIGKRETFVTLTVDSIPLHLVEVDARWPKWNKHDDKWQNES